VNWSGLELGGVGAQIEFAGAHTGITCNVTFGRFESLIR
jgi:hypothetical protein